MPGLATLLLRMLSKGHLVRDLMVCSLIIFHFIDASMRIFKLNNRNHLICIGNSMVSSAIWKKHAQVSFSETIIRGL